MRSQATALIPFVPSGPDFDRAVAFFNDLGFETAWRYVDIAGLRFGGAYFMLQNTDMPGWQENQMLAVEVDDLDTYWSEVNALALPTKYPDISMRPPTDYPWGREVHIIDPAGVCWHFRRSSTA